MPEAREWTAEIQSNGFTLYAWVAFNPEWDTFATSNIEGARMFRSEADVAAWTSGNASPLSICSKPRLTQDTRPAA